MGGLLAFSRGIDRMKQWEDTVQIARAHRSTEEST